MVNFGVYFATTGVSTLPLACTLPPCSKVSMKVSERSQSSRISGKCFSGNVLIEELLFLSTASYASVVI
ncbi:hypothetical protein T4C_13160 [Trichinella pseudospiralis]|uniref:Uncharacterized protein n=1 Tax=Trichinella pseudospiralis TaxID=6337 RepID=A0A0V1GDP1_TRIPS|nr:hypothetical protein T4C_13160 [Trichinella pseudospiralis]